jgi:hypothetical protein
MGGERELTVFETELLRIEQETAHQVNRRLSQPFARLLALLLALWPGDDANMGVKRRVLQRLNVDSLLTPMPGVEAVIVAGSLWAFTHGQLSANDMLQTAGASPLRVAHTLPEGLRREVLHATTAMVEQVSKAKTVLMLANTLEEAQAGLAVAQHGINRAQSVATWNVNSAANEAITTASHQEDSVVSIWRAERDACVHCLAYQGERDLGEGYPAGLTFGAKPLNEDPVERPPLHPHCRCTQWIVEREASVALADSLKREAKRSVLRGWSLPSEGNKVRIDAARKLLNEGSTLPKSVKQYAEQSVKRGEFSRGRKPPV